MDAIRLIIGLGNPGPQYAATRHNAGEWFVHSLAQANAIHLNKERKFFARVSNALIANTPYKIAIPTTYINESGRAALAISEFYNIAPQDILIVHDELDLPAGTARLKFGGGHGGHNGLRDIISYLQTSDFHRLRIGIGHPGHRDQVHNYVLSAPNKSDKNAIDTSIKGALEIVPLVVQGYFAAAMQKLHTTS